MIIQIRNFFIDCKPNHNPENNPEWNLCLHKGKSDTQYYRKKEHTPFNTPTQYCDRGSYIYIVDMHQNILCIINMEVNNLIILVTSPVVYRQDSKSMFQNL